MSWCPYRELGLARGASTDDVKKAFKALALDNHPDRNHHLPAHEQSSAAERFRVIKEAYDTLIDDRKRAAYDATSSSSPYQRRGASGGASAQWANAGVNTDWTRRAGDGGSAGSRGVSRFSRWEWWRRWARHEARAFDRTLHGGLALLTLAGLLFFDAGGDLFWSSRNAGRSFQAAMEQRRQQQQQQQQQKQQQRASGRQEGDGHGTAAAATPTAKRRPGAWLDSMRGRPVPSVDGGAGSGVEAAAERAATTKSAPG